jgi:hypothetical protein
VPKDKIICALETVIQDKLREVLDHMQEGSEDLKLFIKYVD